MSTLPGGQLPSIESSALTLGLYIVTIFDAVKIAFNSADTRKLRSTKGDERNPLSPSSDDNPTNTNKPHIASETIEQSRALTPIADESVDKSGRATNKETVLHRELPSVVKVQKRHVPTVKLAYRTHALRSSQPCKGGRRTSKWSTSVLIGTTPGRRPTS